MSTLCRHTSDGRNPATSDNHMLAQTPSLNNLLEFALDSTAEQAVEILLDYFQRENDIVRVPGDEQCLVGLMDWVSHEIANPQTQQITAHRATTILTLIRIMCVSWNVNLTNHHDVLVSIVGYTNIEDTWTSPQACSEANILLSTHGLDSASQIRSDFIINACLTGYSRTMFPAPNHLNFNKISSSRCETSTIISGPTWKHKDPHACTIIAWAIDNIEPIIMRRNWHLFTPPLLTFLEDDEVATRARALQMAFTFMTKCGPKLLCNTGLVSLLEDALFPSLAQIESINILEPAYDALILLSRLAHEEGDDFTTQYRLLERILRDGILVGYSHVYGYPQAIECLMKMCARVVDALGIRASKHLRHLLLMYEEIMSNSGICYDAASSLSILDALGATIMVTWPRLWTGNHVPNIIRTTVLYWLNAYSVEPSMDTLVLFKLQRIWRLLSATTLNERYTEDGIPLDHYETALVGKNPDLAYLFNSTQ